MLHPPGAQRSGRRDSIWVATSAFGNGFWAWDRVGGGWFHSLGARVLLPLGERDDTGPRLTGARSSVICAVGAALAARGRGWAAGFRSALANRLRGAAPRDPPQTGRGRWVFLGMGYLTWRGMEQARRLPARIRRGWAFSWGGSTGQDSGEGFTRDWGLGTRWAPGEDFWDGPEQYFLLRAGDAGSKGKGRVAARVAFGQSRGADAFRLRRRAPSTSPQGLRTRGDGQQLVGTTDGLGGRFRDVVFTGGDAQGSAAANAHGQSLPSGEKAGRFFQGTGPGWALGVLISFSRRWSSSGSGAALFNAARTFGQESDSSSSC